MNKDDLACDIYDFLSLEDLRAAGARVKNVAGVILRSDVGRIKLQEAGLDFNVKGGLKWMNLFGKKHIEMIL